MSEPELVLRAPTGETREMNFIRRTWLSGLRELPNGLPDTYWWPSHRAYLEDCLANPAIKILIAGGSDDPHEILGYAVASEKVLEWVHVRKGTLRGRGLAGVLLRALGFSREQPPLSRWRSRSSRERLVLLHRPRELAK
jgi:hypothetical protein